MSRCTFEPYCPCVGLANDLGGEEMREKLDERLEVRSKKED